MIWNIIKFIIHIFVKTKFWDDDYSKAEISC